VTASRHAVVSAALAAGCGLAWNSAAAAAGAFAGGTLLDIDHLLDYRWNRVGPFEVRRFVRFCNQYRLRKYYLFLHSFEWLVPFCLVAWLAGAPPWMQAAAVGLVVHIAMDIHGNGMRLSAYFFLFRVRRGFDSRAFVLRLPPEAIRWWGSLEAYRKGRPEKRSSP